MSYMSTLTNLEVTKTGPSMLPWRVVVKTGPSSGTIIAHHRTKRNAMSAAMAVDHLPWEWFYTRIEDAAEADATVVSLPTSEVAAAAVRIERLQHDVEAMRSLIVALNPEIVARFGHGGAIEMDIRKGLRPRELA